MLYYTYTMKKILLQMFSILLIIMTVLLVLGLLAIFVLSRLQGRDTYNIESQKIRTMMAEHPGFFKKTFTEILPAAVQCQADAVSCTSFTRAQFDLLSQPSSTPDNKDHFTGVNRTPMYFIALQPDGTIAKLFFSGDLKREVVDSRGERMVKALLEGKREHLYGSYGLHFWCHHPYYKPQDYAQVSCSKPGFLKDLYSEYETIVTYTENGQIKGAVVFLFGS